MEVSPVPEHRQSSPAIADSALTPEQLAHLRQLAQVLPPLAVTTAADCYGYEDDQAETRWCIYDIGEDDPPLADYMLRSVAGQFVEAINALPALLDLVDRLRPPSDGLDDRALDIITGLEQERERLRQGAKAAHDLIDNAYCGPDQPHAPDALAARAALASALHPASLSHPETDQ
jgi:hypothetical protein